MSYLKSLELPDRYFLKIFLENIRVFFPKSVIPFLITYQDESFEISKNKNEHLNNAQTHTHTHIYTHTHIHKKF